MLVCEYGTAQSELGRTAQGVRSASSQVSLPTGPVIRKTATTAGRSPEDARFRPGETPMSEEMVPNHIMTFGPDWSFLGESS